MNDAKQNEVESGSGISLSDLTVRAGDRVLLEEASAHFRDGDISLIVGPSGVGKSVLLRIIASLVEPAEEGIQYEGTVTVDGHPPLAGAVGVVFQSFALFDELNPVANLEFARDSAGKHASPRSSRELLDELRVPLNVPTSRLSGGQRQRLAIARTLAYNPEAIMYDEPTSGLDPITGTQVAELIRTTHEQFGKTSIVVTHDYRSLLPIADRVILLDPVTLKLVDVPRDEWSTLAERLAPMSRVSRVANETTEPLAWATRIRSSLKQFFVSTAGAGEAVVAGAASLLPVWKNPRWGLRLLWHYMRLVAGPTAWIYLAIAGFVTGFVTTYFTFDFLPFAGYTEPLLIEDLLTALGFATYRLFVPTLATILIAARCGAAVASDVGGRQYSNQIDAMKSFGLGPRQYLLTPILYTFLLGTPFLNFVAYWVARVTSLITFSFTRPEHGPQFWDYFYNRALVQVGGWTFVGSGWLMFKLLCCGVGVALISYYQGRRPKYSTTDVSRGVTATILWATLWILLVHFVFSFYEFDGTIPGSRSAQ